MPEFFTNSPDRLPIQLLANPNESAITLSKWLTNAGDDLPDLLHKNGAILFRGFGVTSAAAFEAVCRSGTPDLTDYTGGGSPRTHVAGKVYTSTEYAADQYIPLHCEYTYFPEVPPYIWFNCEQAPESGGETPIGDMQHVRKKLDPELVNRFETRGVRYIYNLHGGNGFGRGWRESFGTDDQSAVEQWLDNIQTEYHWESDGTLHVELNSPRDTGSPGNRGCRLG